MVCFRSPPVCRVRSTFPFSPIFTSSLRSRNIFLPTTLNSFEVGIVYPKNFNQPTTSTLLLTGREQVQHRHKRTKPAAASSSHGPAGERKQRGPADTTNEFKLIFMARPRSTRIPVCSAMGLQSLANFTLFSLREKSFQIINFHSRCSAGEVSKFPKELLSMWSKVWNRIYSFHDGLEKLYIVMSSNRFPEKYYSELVVVVRTLSFFKRNIKTM